MCENQSIYRTSDLDLWSTNLTFDKRLPMIDINVHVQVKYREDRRHGRKVIARKLKLSTDRLTDGQGKHYMPPATIVAVT